MARRSRQRQPSTYIPANLFDPSQASGISYDPSERLRQLEEGFQQSPGRAPNGSGVTGLQSNDARGWSQMLQEQQEYLRLKDAMGANRGIDVRLGAPLDPTQAFAPATGRYNSESFGRPAWVGGADIEQARAKAATKSVTAGAGLPTEPTQGKREMPNAGQDQARMALQALMRTSRPGVKSPVRGY